MKDLNRETLGKVKIASHDISGRTAIAGMFKDYEQAKNAVDSLKRAGFQDNQIGVVVRDRDTQGQLLDETNLKNDHTGAATGAIGGTILGGLAGLLLGTGSLLIPGVGPVIAGGIFAESLGAAALGAGIGAAGGGLLGSLADMGMSDDDAHYFENGFRTGNILVTVKSADRMEEALEILMRNGGDVGSVLKSRDVYAQDTTNFDKAYTQPVKNEFDRNIDRRDNQTLELKQEELKVDKHQVEAGEVVLNKKVVEEQKTVDVPVTHEEIVIERHMVNEKLPAGTEFGRSEEEVRVPVMEERLDVSKQAYVTEEVNVGKRKVTENQHISETLKREEAYIKNQGDVDVRFDDKRDI